MLIHLIISDNLSIDVLIVRAGSLISDGFLVMVSNPLI